MVDTVKNILALIISLSTVLGIFTKIINSLFSKKLEPINERLEKTDKRSLENRMQTARFNVVNFACEVRNGAPKTRYQFEAIFQYINFYEEAVHKLGITNNLFNEEKEYIIQKYHDLDK